MILDSLQNAEKYESLHPAFKEAFEYIKNTDFTKIEPGIIELGTDQVRQHCSGRGGEQEVIH